MSNDKKNTPPKYPQNLKIEFEHTGKGAASAPIPTFELAPMKKAKPIKPGKEKKK